MAYLKSEAVTLFPSAYRGCYTSGAESGKVYDPESRLFTEKNSGYPYRALSSVKDGSFVVDFDKTNSIIKFVLHGYYFEADFYNGGESELLTNDLWAVIKLANKGSSASGNYQALSLINQSGDQSVLDTNDYFCGVRFEASAPTLTSGEYALQLLSGGEVLPASYQKFKSSEVQIGESSGDKDFVLSDLIAGKQIGGINTAPSGSTSACKYPLNNVCVGNPFTTDSYARIDKDNLVFYKKVSGSPVLKAKLDTSNASDKGLTLNNLGIKVNGADVNITNSGNIGGNLIASRNATISGSLSVDSNTILGGNVDISGILTVDNEAKVNEKLTVNGDAELNGGVYIDGTLSNRSDVEIEEGDLTLNEGDIQLSEGCIHLTFGPAPASGDIFLEDGRDRWSLRQNFVTNLDISAQTGSGGYEWSTSNFNGVTLGSGIIDNVPKLYVKSTTNTNNLYLPLLESSGASSGKKDVYVQTGIYVYTPTSSSGTKILTAPKLAEGTDVLEDKYIQKSSFLKKGQLLIGTGSGEFKAAPAYPNTSLAYTHLAYNATGDDLVWTEYQYVNGKAGSGSTQYFTSSSTKLNNTTDAKNINIKQSPDALYYYVSSSGVTLYSTNFNGTNFTGTNYFGTSDARLKENVTDTSLDSVKLLSDIKIRDFNWKEDKPENKNIGVIAQELEEIVPEEYKKEFIASGEYLAVNDSKFVYVLIDAFKKLKAEVDELKDKLGGK